MLLLDYGSIQQASKKHYGCKLLRPIGKWLIISDDLLAIDSNLVRGRLPVFVVRISIQRCLEYLRFLQHLRVHIFPIGIANNLSVAGVLALSNHFITVGKRHGDAELVYILHECKPARFGTLLALAGILVLTPDTLVIRLSGLERWTLMGWRGILMGLMSFAIWWLLFTRQPRRDLRTVLTWQGLFVIRHIQPEFSDLHAWHCRDIGQRGVNSGCHHANFCGNFIGIFAT